MVKAVKLKSTHIRQKYIGFEIFPGNKDAKPRGGYLCCPKEPEILMGQLVNPV